MSDKRRIHITKHESGWAITREGAHRASEIKETKESAIKAGIGIAKKEKGELIIHKKERNAIQEERTYRKDPYPPKG